MRPTTGAVTAALLALTITACGGDKAPSKGDYIAKADKVCKRYSVEGNKLSTNLSPSSAPAEFSAFAQKAVPLARKENAELRALKRPKGDEAELDSVYAQLSVATDKVDAVKSDGRKVLDLLQNHDPFGSANAVANAYGFKECGK